MLAELVLSLQPPVQCKLHPSSEKAPQRSRLAHLRIAFVTMQDLIGMLPEHDRTDVLALVALRSAHHWRSISIMLTVLGINFLGDGLRDMLDTRRSIEAEH